MSILLKNRVQIVDGFRYGVHAPGHQGTRSMHPILCTYNIQYAITIKTREPAMLWYLFCSITAFSFGRGDSRVVRLNR